MKVSGIYIELLEDCNLRCRHCYNFSGTRTKRLDIESLKKIVAYIETHYVDGVSLSGGEPFLHPQIIDILTLFVNSGVSRISIVTNATMLSKEILEKMLSMELLNKIAFQVSLDGVTPKQHDYIRGDGAFKKLERGLDLLDKYHAKYYFHCVIHKENYLFIDDIINYSNNIHNVRVDFSLLKKKGRGIENFKDISLNIQEQIEVIKKLHLRKEKNNINAPSVFYGSCPLFSDGEAETFIRIDAKGDVYPCQNFNYVGSSLGNVKFENLEEICSEHRMMDLKQRINEFRYAYSKCSSCALMSYCQSGCPGVEYCEESKKEISNECLLRKEYFKQMLIESGVVRYAFKK